MVWSFSDTWQNSPQVFRGTLQFMNGNYRHVITPFLNKEWNSFHWHHNRSGFPLQSRDIFRERPTYMKILSHLTYLAGWLPLLCPKLERKINIQIQKCIVNVLNHQLLKFPAGAMPALISQSWLQRCDCACLFLAKGRSTNVFSTWPVLSIRIRETSISVCSSGKSTQNILFYYEQKGLSSFPLRSPEFFHFLEWKGIELQGSSKTIRMVATYLLKINLLPFVA